MNWNGYLAQQIIGPSMSLPNDFNRQIYRPDLPTLFIVRNLNQSNLPVLFMVDNFHSFCKNNG